jgi:hypothetical protein
MGFFDNIDIDDVPDNPNELPNDTYKFEVTSAKLGPTKDNSKIGITFKYQIIEGPWATFFPISDWVQVPDEKTPRDQVVRMLSSLKMRLLAFGFTPDQIKTWDKGHEMQCIKKRFFGTTGRQKREGQTDNIRVLKFDPIGDGADTLVDFPDDI